MQLLHSAMSNKVLLLVISVMFAGSTALLTGSTTSPHGCCWPSRLSGILVEVGGKLRANKTEAEFIDVSIWFLLKYITCFFQPDSEWKLILWHPVCLPDHEVLRKYGRKEFALPGSKLSLKRSLRAMVGKFFLMKITSAKSVSTCLNHVLGSNYEVDALPRLIHISVLALPRALKKWKQALRWDTTDGTGHLVYVVLRMNKESFQKFRNRGGGGVQGGRPIYFWRHYFYALITRSPPLIIHRHFPSFSM